MGTEKLLALLAAGYVLAIVAGFVARSGNYRQLAKLKPVPVPAGVR